MRGWFLSPLHEERKGLSLDVVAEAEAVEVAVVAQLDGLELLSRFLVGREGKAPGILVDALDLDGLLSLDFGEVSVFFFDVQVDVDDLTDGGLVDIPLQGELTLQSGLVGGLLLDQTEAGNTGIGGQFWCALTGDLPGGVGQGRGGALELGREVSGVFFELLGRDGFGLLRVDGVAGGHALLGTQRMLAWELCGDGVCVFGIDGLDGLGFAVCGRGGQESGDLPLEPDSEVVLAVGFGDGVGLEG